MFKEGPNVAKMLRQSSTTTSDVIESKKGKGAKGKKGKARGRGGGDDDDEIVPSSNQVEFMPKHELVQTLINSDTVGNCPEEVIDEICEKLVK